MPYHGTDYLPFTLVQALVKVTLKKSNVSDALIALETLDFWEYY